MPKPIHNLRWWPTELVFLSMVINHIDRQRLAVLAPDLPGSWASQAFSAVGFRKPLSKERRTLR